ncbi:MOSC domain-containing protein [Acuticoccus sediminis]|uniref:MOSC domain-containing protein n=1 Tax=Acuticoccus sediminis TaxID=2184697 RepID=UPI001CFE4047|nr:MOSC domain-containing protein [Acuticoccus sediminis]
MDAAVVNVFASNVRHADFPSGTAPTGYAREAVKGPARVGPHGIIGDEIADPRSLGRDNHAIYLFNRDHYAHFEALLTRPLRPGTFAENVLYEGPDEFALRIGDEIRIGSVRLALTTPRIPCHKLWHFVQAEQGFSAQFSRSNRTGVYARVLEGGDIRAGDSIAVVRSDPRNATIAELNAAMTRFDCDAGLLTRVLSSPDLLPGAADAIRRRVAGNQPELLAEPVRARVVGWRRLSHDVTELRITAPPTTDFGWKPGQFLTLALPVGTGATLFRCYSLTAGPPDAPFTVAVRRNGAAGHAASVSQHLFDADMTGTAVTLYPPSGDFCLPDIPGDAVTYIAGGIGITPILAHLRHLAAGAARPSVRLVYIARDRAAAVFHDELRALAEGWDTLDYQLHLTRPGVATAGRPDVDTIVAEAPEEAPLYVCGPPGLVHAVRAAHERRGRSNAALFYELFEAPGAGGEIAETVPCATVRLPDADISGTWRLRDGTLLDWIVARTPFRPPAACRAGLCRTCMAVLSHGAVAYPAGIAAPGHGRVLLCCARPASADLAITLPATTQRLQTSETRDVEEIQ